MVHTVGIVGVNGNIGAPTSKLLVKAAEDGKIKLVLFYRSGSAFTTPHSAHNVETRLLNFDDPAESIERAVRGINVFISAVGFGALPTEPNIVDALAKSPDLVCYIPSTYSTTWNAADFQDPHLGPVLTYMHAGWERAKQKGIGIAVLFIGSFENFFFEAGFVGAPLKGNTIWANEKQLQNPFPITVREHVAEALARVATSEPQSMKNKRFSAVTFWPTGQELAELYTKLNGKQAQIKDLTKEDREAAIMDAANFGPVKVGYWDRWESNNWGYESEENIVDKDYSGPDLEEIARRFL